MREIGLQLLQSRQRLGAILDVRQQNVPAGNTAGIIADWDEAGVKPPIFAVDASQTCFVMEGNTGNYRFLKNLEDTGKVFRMYDVNFSPVLQLFGRPAKILEHLAIDVFEFTIRGCDRDETGYPVNCRAQATLALTQSLFGAFEFVNVSEEVVPPQDATIRIPKRTCPGLKPAIDAIKASSPKFDLERLTRRHRLGKDFDDAWKIFRMNHVLPARF